MNHRRHLAVIAVLALLVAWVPAADSGAADNCTYFAGTGLEYHSGYGWVCGGNSTNGCTECWKWTSASSIESCVTAGDANCLTPAVKN